MRRTRRQNERGFALLLVFAMAAAVVAMLYLEMPRVAFEHQRNKEGLLAERGEQYIRAIQLFYKKTNRYPQKIEDLESTNNIRFLRRRYKDPMTGEEEWRLIHVDSAGQYVDSLVHKRTEEKKESGPSALSSNIVGIGASAEYVPQAGEKTGAAAIRRASDRIIPGMGGTGQPSGQTADPGAEGADQSRSGPAQATPPSAPGQGQGQGTGTPTPGMNPQTGQGTGTGTGTGAGTGTGNSSGQQGNQFGSGGGFGMGSGFGSGSNGSGSTTPGTGQGQNQNPRQTGGFPGSGQSGSNSPFSGNAGSQPGSSNDAVRQIQGMLTSGPRQSGMMNGGMGGSTTGGASANGGATQGGIVGVASKRDMEGIRLYNERSNYKEWEFLYDRKKALETEGLGQQGQQNQQSQQGMGANGQNQGQGSTSPFSFGGSGSQQPKPAPGGFGSGGFGSTTGSTGSTGFGKGN